MRIATVLVVAAAYGVFVDALSQDVPGHSMLRNLASADENQSHLVPALYLMADSANVCTSWGADLSCVFDGPTNSVKLGDSSCQHVPIPTDNYVSDKRKNKFDGALTDPYTGQPSIEVTATKQGTTDKKTTGRQTWKDYKANALAIQQSAIQFTTPGLYDTSITASDYGASASCPGCLAVRDEFRPNFGKECPIPADSSVRMSLSEASLAKAAEVEALYIEVTSGYENNAESEDPPEGMRCGFSYSGLEAPLTFDMSEHATCYTADDWHDNLSRFKSFPFALIVTEPLDTLPECHWSCYKRKTLEEWYVPYSCSNPAATGSCVGRNDKWSKCSLTYMLTATGVDIAKTTVALSQTAKDNSATVIASLGSPAGADKETDIYRTIPCTEFASATNTDPTCVYKQKLSKLLATTTDYADYFPTDRNGVEASELVFWRYKRSGEEWAVWDPTADTELSFSLQETTVSVEAWTACGQVGSTFSFKVKLYLHTSLVCNSFAGLWTAVSGPEKPGRSFCNVPGSDFTVMKFKYASTDIFPLDVLKSKVTGTATNVKCEMAVKETGADATQTVTILDSADTAIDRDFAIELVHDPNTAPSTTVDVTCTFTRTAHINGDAVMLADTDPHTIDCSDAFTLVDCDEPELLPGVAEADVCADKCAGDTEPGLGEACGGYIVTADGTSTSFLQHTADADQTCCDKCGNLVCNAAGGSSTAKACMPQVVAAPVFQNTPSVIFPTLPVLDTPDPSIDEEDMDNEDDEMATLLAAEEKVFASGTATTLLGASALVAVVALVVVKRRADAAARAMEDEDAYSLLLE